MRVMQESWSDGWLKNKKKKKEEEENEDEEEKGANSLLCRCKRWPTTSDVSHRAAPTTA